VSPVKEVLTKASVTTDSVAKLIFCGGTAKVPILRRAVAAALPSAQVSTTSGGVNPDELLAAGGAAQAALLSGTHRIEPSLGGYSLPVLGYSVVFSTNDKTEDADMSVLLAAGSPLPARGVVHPDSLPVRVYCQKEGQRALLAKVIFATVIKYFLFEYVLLICI